MNARGPNAEKGEELFKWKHYIGTSAARYKLAVIKCLQEIRRSVSLRAAGLWKSLQENREGRARAGFVVELSQRGTGFQVRELPRETLLVLHPQVPQMLRSEYKGVESSRSQRGIKLCC